MFCGLVPSVVSDSAPRLLAIGQIETLGDWLCALSPGTNRRTPINAAAAQGEVTILLEHLHFLLSCCK